MHDIEITPVPLILLSDMHRFFEINRRTLSMVLVMRSFAAHMFVLRLPG